MSPVTWQAVASWYIMCSVVKAWGEREKQIRSLVTESGEPAGSVSLKTSRNGGVCELTREIFHLGRGHYDSPLCHFTLKPRKSMNWWAVSWGDVRRSAAESKTREASSRWAEAAVRAAEWDQRRTECGLTSDRVSKPWLTTTVRRSSSVCSRILNALSRHHAVSRQIHTIKR